MAACARFPDLRHWLEWQQSLHPAAIDLGLERARRVLARTGWRAPAEPVITVGGTNGKGSCVALLAAMLRAGGYRVGTFTSPHLVSYNERVCVDGRPASDASLVAAFERLADALGPDSLTFFEFNALAALLVFETAAPDALVLEVGMGGRLDAVNLVDADVAIVVSVGLDHMEWLGADVEAIGREKAGIFRPGRPAIVGTREAPQSVLDEAERCGALLVLRGRDFDGDLNPDGSWDYRDGADLLGRLPRPALAGNTQVGNAATVLAACRALSARLPLARSAIEDGLRQVVLPGRFQRVAGPGAVEWILDVAHNPDSARVLVDNLVLYPAQGRTIAVCGMLADKDVDAVFGILRERVDRWFAAGTDGPRGLDSCALQARASGIGVAMTSGGSVVEAMRLAEREARPGDRILVFGSFHTVGPALEYLLPAGVGGGYGAPCV